MLTDEIRRGVAEHITTAVAWGRADCLTIVEDTVEYLDGAGDPDEVRALAWQLAGPRFAAHLAAQSTWPVRTDSDRLTDAFRALDASGIVAREDFSCCQNCGVTEISAAAASARGYVFYHAQDAERAARGGSLWLAYGSFEQPGLEQPGLEQPGLEQPGLEPPTAGIGEEIAAALRAEGLDVDWAGTAGQRLHVRVAWARRRHGRLAAHLDDPTGPDTTVEVTKGRLHLPPRLPAVAVTHLLLPWLPEGVSVRVGGAVPVHRELHKLVSDDGRSAGRFDGAQLLAGGDVSDVPDEPGLLDVTYQCMPDGPAEVRSRPMVLPEILDVLRRMPTRTDSWLSAISVTGGIVQLRWEQARLWLETPHPADGTATGKHATLDEAIQILTILATDDRVAISDLPGVTTQPWG